MKINLFFILLLQSTTLMANVGFQLGTGGITPHFNSKKMNYCNQWNNSGLIVNKTYYFRLLLGRMGVSYMRGNDSICSEIEGIFLHYAMKSTKVLDIGVTFGGYAYNEQNWLDHEQKTPQDIAAPSPTTVDFYGRSICPMLALDLGVHLIRRRRWSLKLNNLFTPIITNHSMAFEYRF